MLDREADLAIGIDRKHLDLNFVAFFQKVFHIAYINVSDFRNVDQTDFSTGEFNKCAEIGNSRYGSFNYRADFNRHAYSRSPL